MSEQILKISNEFWNIRGVFKIAGVLNIGTHASLVRRKNGKFLLLDAYTLQGKVKEQVDALTNNGVDIEAIINLHPFHTVHVQKMHAQYPKAKLYGTRRHIEKFPDLPWEIELVESQSCAELFSEDLAFSVPAGVDFISSNEQVHFSSVLAYHMASKTIHSDDTLMYLQLPGLLGKVKKPEVSFHMTLSKTLEKRAGAVKAFRTWATELTHAWHDAEHLCAAHSAAYLGRDKPAGELASKILLALDKVEKVLKAHEKKFG